MKSKMLRKVAVSKTAEQRQNLAQEALGYVVPSGQAAGYPGNLSR